MKTGRFLLDTNIVVGLFAGKPIPENDLWIAATAICFDLTLVTRDAHFSGLPGLGTTPW